MNSGFLSVSGAAKTFGAATVLDGVDLSMGRGEFISLLGPSGCGKTTLLRIVAGLMAPDQGKVALDGEDITRRPPHRRDVSVVFQNYALFPHLSVAENVAFGLKARGAPKNEIAPTVARYLGLVQMGAFAGRSIRALSGGQQQRVAVARALAVGPKLLLLDEPFSALDRKLREAMQIDLKRILREVGTTAIFVTHDQDEALTMSDRIAVMHRGRIEQLDTPAEIYHRPATPFALGFVGLSTQLPGKVVQAADGMVEVDTEAGRLRAKANFIPGSAVLVGVRPERVAIGETKANRIEAVLADAAFQGARVQLHFAAPEGGQILAEVPALPADARPGTRLTLSWNVEDTLVYPALDLVA
ncbi:MAG TPA: ABC transporter ATP-binding protein [Bosea sp. (in: a-proteobacteria)]|jgi:putative spermidine/putrescine transport system ATP-binding protein|uniref:ABC transporter ATP-binding protein n=1 Tax=Bosea sp. (in: a-proteobacteria) TaxID=1871050 RepID=UPI002E0F4314|nr:ABC transporter ATP-binding protein [Bosea sp. (in: a-proteobacteria)]